MFSIYKHRRSGFGVVVRDLLRQSERQARIAHMREMAWTDAQIERELRAMEGWRLASGRRSLGLDLCRQFVAHHATPGDIVLDLGVLHIVCQRSEA
jgi:hypothetical protein